MTKEEVLQKVNDYCTEKQYTVETLTDDFKDKFAGFFLEKYKDNESGLDDENILADLKFNINTAFSATSKGLTSKQQAFDAKENELKRQIEELNRKLGNAESSQPIPKDLQEKLDELERFKNEQRKSEMYKDIIEKAKSEVREDLHKSLENYAKYYPVKLDEASDEQARKLVVRFQEIFKDSLGNIKPLAPQRNEKRDQAMLESIPKIKI